MKKNHSITSTAAVELIQKEIAQRLAIQEKMIVAIDGPSGSGKTTLAALLATAYGDQLQVVHCDDYFLPPAKRTAIRLAMPCANLEHERLQAEVLVPHAGGLPLTLRRYDCQTDRFDLPQVQQLCPITLVEGCYSMHPQLLAYYDLTIFLTTTPEVQRARLYTRSTPDQYQRYITEWIPLENACFAAAATAQQATLCLALDDPC